LGGGRTSARVHVPLLEVFTKIAGGNPVPTTNTDGSHISRLYEAVDRHVRNPQLTSDLGYGQESAVDPGSPTSAIGLAHVGGSIATAT
jgi:hypothetical protein